MGRHAGVDAATTRGRILDATIDLVSREGYVATSMADVAKAIEMTQGALYWHFGSKEALLVAAIEELQRRLVVELSRTATDAVGQRPADLLGALVARVADVAAAYPTYFRFIAVVTAEATETSAPIEAALRSAYEGVASVLAGVLEAGKEDQLVDPDLDVTCASELFLGLYMGGLLHQRLFRKRLPAKRALPVLVRMMEASVSARPKRTRRTTP